MTHAYATPGLYSVTLTVSNSAAELTSLTKSAYILVAPSNTFVAPGGSDTAPYDTWAKAATAIQPAVDAMLDGGTVHVSNGTYMVTEPVSIGRGITVVSVNGDAVTRVQRLTGTTRLFGLGHSGAVVDGFTLAAGSAPTTADQGGGVYMTAGTMRNCTITNCTAVFGGGVYMSGGTVSNCTLIKNPTKGGGGSSGRGGAVYMTGGTVTHSTLALNTSVRAGGAVDQLGGTIASCIISGNISGHGGGGVAMEAAARIENCLIVDNKSGSYLGGGGGIYMNNAGCRVVNCTVVDNETAGTGGGIHRNTGLITNTIVYYNTITATGSDDDLDTGGSEAYFSHCCSPDLTHDPAGSGNITSLPGFTDRGADDYTLAAGSACIDAGSNVTDIVSDQAGTARPLDGDGDGSSIHDIGAYEAPDASAGPLEVNFSALATEGALTLNAQFSVTATGSDTNDLYYRWDFDGDGTNDLAGYGQGAPSHLYDTPGFYTVSLTASNASAQTDSETKPDYIKVFAAATYVATNGAHTPAFDTWAKAATNIQDAVDAVMDGGTVAVRAGTYILAAPVSVTKGVTIASESGADVTTVTRTAATRLFSLAHSNAVIDGLTLKAGYDASQGGGVFMSNGRIQNCTITNCQAVYGAGIYMTGGTVSNCWVMKNPTLGGGGSSGQGGGVYMSGGTVEFSTFDGNTSARNGAGIRMAGGAVRHCTVRNGYSGFAGGGLWVDGTAPSVHNCLVIDNSGGDYANGYGRGGGGIYIGSASAAVENCTVVGNVTRTTVNVGRGGGIYLLSGAVRNTIAIGNTADADPNVFGGSAFVYSCSPDLAHDPAGTGNINSDPLMVDTNTGDYRLTTASPCINAGTNTAWVATAVDLEGAQRVQNDTVDMGAYETYLPPQGTMFMLR